MLRVSAVCFGMINTMPDTNGNKDRLLTTFHIVVFCLDTLKTW